MGDTPRQSALVSISMVVSLMLMMPSASAYSKLDLYRSTREPKLIQALEYLADSPASLAADFIVTHQVKVLFKDMREFGKVYKRHDALTIISDETDEQIIYINQAHANAPPQALAAIISHEAMHFDRENSVNEEVQAWFQEATTWQHMVVRYPDLKQIKTKQYPLVDRLNALGVLVQQRKLEEQVRNNPHYTSLPEHSPGF